MPATLQPKSQILNSLVRAFRRNGYDGASLSRLSDETGLKRASLYHHFPGGKEEMARAVLISANTNFQEAVLGALDQPGTPKQRLVAMAAALSNFYDGGKETCLLALMTTGEGREVLAPQVREGLTGWINTLASVLEQAGQPQASARERAQDAVARVQGALVLSRGLGDTKAFERLVARLPHDLLA
ncbi:MAG TPA: TetR/AcrR family transcriptional regulator [Allosphingosinicella sp.]|jgi:AcrR family transcriptional regulator|uniref:TetR/AcrR family transcriptional regulator n=1 Tax=Allosphingosinicella sp. TaxID=2823234 RepID=UPI002F2A9494